MTAKPPMPAAPTPSTLQQLSVERRAVRTNLRDGKADEAHVLLERIWNAARALPEDPAAPPDERGADLFQALAQDFARLDDLPHALEAGARGLAIEDKLHRPILRRGTLMFLATLHARVGDHASARLLGREALVMYESDLGPNHAEVRGIKNFLKNNGAR